MGKKVKIDIQSNDFEKQLKKAINRAIKTAANDKIAPEVRKKLEKKTKIMMRNSFKPNNNVELSKNKDAIASLNREKKHLISTLSSDIFIKSSPFSEEDNKFYVYNFTEPNDPIWKSRKEGPDLLVNWIVNGKMVVHPALTKYRGKYINDDIKEENENSATDVKSWDEYVDKYRFDKVPFVDATINELKKPAFRKFVKNSIIESIDDELGKILKNK